MKPNDYGCGVIVDIIFIIGLIPILIGALMLSGGDHHGFVWIGVGCLFSLPEVTVRVGRPGLTLSGCAGVVLILIGGV